MVVTDSVQCKRWKSGKATEPSETTVELITASGESGDRPESARVE